MTSPHTHQKTDELHVFTVPADSDHKPELQVVGNQMTYLQTLVGGYVERLSNLTEQLSCGCAMVMLVDEDARMKRSEVNTRASVLYPFATLRGDVVLVGEGPVVQSDGTVETEWFSLPQSFNQWEGPGAPIPRSEQPWEVSS